jgi:hypothetical protein
MPPNVHSFAELLREARKSAVHLEMRDVYGIADEAADFEAWRAGRRVDWDNRDEWWHDFYAGIAQAVARGVRVRRARVVSEPLTEYIRYEHYITRANITAGEEVRWLPRRRASDIALPGNDFWLFDQRLVRFNHFTGDGRFVTQELDDDPAVVRLCSAAFEAVWVRAVPHEEYFP